MRDLKLNTSIPKLELQTGVNMKLTYWAKAELSAGQYVIEHDTLHYEKYLAIKMGCSVPGIVFEEVYHPEHMARTQYVFPFHIQ